MCCCWWAFFSFPNFSRSGTFFPVASVVGLESFSASSKDKYMTIVVFGHQLPASGDALLERPHGPKEEGA